LSNVIHTTDHRVLNELLDQHETVVVDFSALAWCVPCQRLAPHFDAASLKLPGVVFVAVDIDTADSDITDEYQIQSVPTVYAFKHGKRTTIKGRTVMQLIGEINSL
jgi:thioredoxin 1